MRTAKELRLFWVLARKAIGKDEAHIRRWLHDNYGVFSPHDLKPDDFSACIARLETMQADDRIEWDCWNEGKIVECPQLRQFLVKWADKLGWRLTHKGTDMNLTYPIDDRLLDLLYKLLAYFTPCSLSDAADLLGRIKETVRRYGLTETVAAIQTFFAHHEKINRKRYVYPHHKLPKRYLLRLFKAIPAARKRMWAQLVKRDLASRMAENAISAFAKATAEAAKEAITRRQKMSAGN